MPFVEVSDEEGNTNQVRVPKEKIYAERETEEGDYAPDPEAEIAIKRQSDLDKSFASRANREQRKTLKKVGLDPKEVKDEEGNINIDSDTAFKLLARKRGHEIREDGKLKGSIRDEEYNKMKKKASKLDKIQQEKQELEEKIHSAREKELRNEFVSSASDLNPEATDEAFGSLKQQYMMWDDEYGWVLEDEDGEPVYDAGEPLGVQSAVEKLREEKPFYFRSGEATGGPDSSPDKSPAPSGDTITRREYENQKQTAIQKKDDEKLKELEQKLSQGKVI